MHENQKVCPMVESGSASLQPTGKLFFSGELDRALN
jgi:hypothetical protein